MYHWYSEGWVIILTHNQAVLYFTGEVVEDYDDLEEEDEDDTEDEVIYYTILYYRLKDQWLSVVGSHLMNVILL